MISRWLASILFVVVFVPGFLHAQTPNPFYSSPEPKPRRQPPKGIDNNTMYEDIEIFRRILDRKLTSLYPSVPSKSMRTDPFDSGSLWIPADGFATGNSKVLTPQGHFSLDERAIKYTYLNILPIVPSPTTIPLQSLEGVYLSGQGVVFTATVSSLQPPANAEADSSSPRWRVAGADPEAEWDRVRRQVRHEKKEPKKLEVSKPPLLSDSLLELLQQNGHRFSQLSENESVTIVLTVHEASPSSSAAKSGTRSAKAESNAAPNGTNAFASKDAGNLGMLGQLHLKQEKYDVALEAFQKLLKFARSPEQEALVRRRLAQCYLGLGQDEKARAELEQALAILKKMEQDKGKPAAKHPTALPVKLIVSAPKKLLDQVHEGKIPIKDYSDPARDFYHQANVETLRFGDRR